MLTAYFDLNEADIQSLRLNDKIRIDNSWWFINKVIDYDPNVKQLTKVELMSIDTEIDFVRFDKRPITYKPNKSQYNQAVGEIFRQRSLTSNTYGQGSDVLIKGINNTTLPSTRGFIEGDGNILEQDGIITTTEGQNFANTDLTFDDNRNHDQAGYYLLLSNGTTFFIENPVTMIDNSSSQAALDIQKDSLTDPALRLEAINGVALKIVDGGLQYRYYLDANPTVNITTNYHIVEVSNIAATVNLPTAVGYEGLSFVIKYTGTGTATVDGNGTETIDGATTRALIQNESIEIVSNGSDWLII